MNKPTNQKKKKKLPASPLRDLLFMSYPTLPRSALLLCTPSAMMIHISLTFVRMIIISLPFTHHKAEAFKNVSSKKKIKSAHIVKKQKED